MNNKKPISKISWNATLLQLEVKEKMSYHIDNANVVQRVRNACSDLKKRDFEFTTSVLEESNSILITRVR